MRRGQARALPGLMLAMLMGALDQTIMAPALPTIAADLGGLERMPFVVTAYLAAATAVMPLYGKLGDRFGRKPVTLAAVVIFTVGAALSGLAVSMPQLIAARTIQGLGGGGLMIAAQAIVGELFSPRERGRYLGLLGAAYVVAAVGGPLAGGFFIDRLSWRWIFAIYPPLGLLTLVVMALTLRLPRPCRAEPVDYAGAAALAVTVVGVVGVATLAQGVPGLPGWSLPAAAATAAVAFIAWLLTARRAADPVLPLRLFRERAFAIPVAIAFVVGFAQFGVVTYLPAFLQIAAEMSATAAGLLITTLMAGVLITTVLSGRLITATGRYKGFPVAGTAVAAAGMLLLAAAAAGRHPPSIAGAMVVTGLGVGMVLQVVVLAAQNAVPYRDLGAATSAVTFLRQIGTAAGVALIGTLVTARVAALAPGVVLPEQGLSPQGLADLAPAARERIAAAFGTAMPPLLAAMAAVLGVAFALALALPVRPLRTAAHIETEGTDAAHTCDTAGRDHTR